MKSCPLVKSVLGFWGGSDKSSEDDRGLYTSTMAGELYGRLRFAPQSFVLQDMTQTWIPAISSFDVLECLLLAY